MTTTSSIPRARTAGGDRRGVAVADHATAQNARLADVAGC
jgi:hypothetical protein